MNPLDSLVPTLTERTFQGSGLCPGSPVRGGLSPKKKKKKRERETERERERDAYVHICHTCIYTSFYICM